MSKTLIHPYSDIAGLKPLRGNLHAHSTRSDGMDTPQRVVDDYAGRGYDFLMLSDHDLYTTDAELAALNGRGMVLILGNEVSAAGPHLLHVGPGGFVAPDPQRQSVITAITQGGGLAIINHPNWQDEFDHCTLAQLREWVGYSGMEIYNGVICRLQGSPYATNKWDRLLSMGKRVWGFANDDSHQPQKDVGLGWNMVYAKERTPAAILEALRQGRFYASTGVVITKIAVDGATIRIETSNAQRIVASMQHGQRCAVVDDKVMELTAPPNARYVRFECWGAGESFAWTQPFLIEQSKTGGAQRDFLTNWYVSDLVERLETTSARPVSPEDKQANLEWSEVQAGGPRLPDGFVDTRPQSGARTGVVYCWTKFQSPADGVGQLYLGYDGPVRAWVNGEQVLDGPGTNPAIPDKAALHVTLKRGPNILVVALGTNQGKAWGIFARCETPKA